MKIILMIILTIISMITMLMIFYRIDTKRWEKEKENMIANKQYIWCVHGPYGNYSPIGDSKTLEFAMSLYEAKHPEKYKLFELKEVKKKGNKK